MSLEFVDVKEEFEVDLIEEPSEESYMEHEVKCELEIGPELLLAPDVSSMFQGVTEQDTCVLVEQPFQDTIRCNIKLLKPCFVKLEHLPYRKDFLEKLMKSNSRKLIFACEFCSSYMFQFRYELKQHKVIHVKQLLRSYDENVASYFGFIMKDDTHIGYKPYSCDICLRQFIKEIDLSNHTHIHEELQNSTLSKENEGNLRKQLYPERNMTDVYAKYQRTEQIANFCISCGTVVRATLDGFARHLVLHMEENPVLKQILKDFTERERLKSICNYYYDLDGRKVYYCPLCSRMFITYLNYRKHMEANRHQNHKCEICHEILPSVEMLLQHKYKHNDNSFPPISIVPYSLKEPPSEAYSTKQPQETIPTNHQATRDPPNPAGANKQSQDEETNLKSSKESIDFQKSSLFSRLNLLNQTLSSNVVGKSSDC